MVSIEGTNQSCCFFFFLSLQIASNVDDVFQSSSVSNDRFPYQVESVNSL